jgi:hypothetical protein
MMDPIQKRVFNEEIRYALSKNDSCQSVVPSERGFEKTPCQLHNLFFGVNGVL